MIIRLQNLAWSANALDIRRLFSGLSIPDGGVHIVGGENGDAFIAFASDEDARKAMHMDGTVLLQNPIKLFLSSKNEMQNVIAIARGAQAMEQMGAVGGPSSDTLPGQQGFPNRPGFDGQSGFGSHSAPMGGFPSPQGPGGLQGPGYGRNMKDSSPAIQRPFAHGRPGDDSSMRGPGGEGNKRASRWDPMSDEPGRDQFDGRPDFDHQRFMGVPAEFANPRDARGGMPGPMHGGEKRMVNRGLPYDRMDMGRGGDFPHEPEMRSAKPSILGDKPLNFGRADDVPPRRILLADPEPVGFGSNGFPGGDMPRDGNWHDGPDRWQENNQHGRDRGMGGDRYGEGFNPPFPEGRPRGPFGYSDERGRPGFGPRGDRDRSPLRRGPGMQGGPVCGRERKFGAGSEEYPNEDLYVYVSNMPTSISYREVRRFFAGCLIPSNGLKLINDETGKRKGTAYVMFVSEQAQSEAVTRDGQLMMGRAVSVVPASVGEFANAEDSYVPSREPRGGSPNPIRMESHPSEYCLEVRNIPFRAVRTEIKHFFSKLRLTPSGGPIMDIGPDGRFTGVVYLQVLGHRDMEEAMDMNGRDFMGRSIEVIAIRKRLFDEKCEKENDERGRDVGSRHSRDRERSSRDDHRDRGKDRERERERPRDREREKDKDLDRDKRSGKKETSDRELSDKDSSKERSSDRKEKFYCVKLEGLPYSANNYSVKDFFDGLEIAQRGIHLTYNEHHQCGNIGYVEFVTSGDCEKAVAKNNEYMGKRFITVIPITKKDMLDELSKDRSGGRPHESSRGRGRGAPYQGRGMPSRHPSGGFRDVDPEYGGRSRDRAEPSRFGDRHLGDRGHRAEMGFEGGRGDMSHLDDRRVERSEHYYDDGRGDYGRRVEVEGNEAMGGATVGMYNVHHVAAPKDILDFFRGYPVISRSVQLLQTPDGRPTGTAHVTFSTAEDAMAAVQQLDQRELMGRTVDLCLL